MTGYNPNARSGYRDWSAYYYWAKRTRLLPDTWTVAGFLTHEWGHTPAARQAALTAHAHARNTTMHALRDAGARAAHARERSAQAIHARSALSRDAATEQRLTKLDHALERAGLPNVEQLHQLWGAEQLKSVLGSFIEPRKTAPYPQSEAVSRVETRLRLNKALAARKQEMDRLLVAGGRYPLVELQEEYIRYSLQLREAVGDALDLVEVPATQVKDAADGILARVARIDAGLAAKATRQSALEARLREAGINMSVAQLNRTYDGWKTSSIVRDFLHEEVTVVATLDDVAGSLIKAVREWRSHAAVERHRVQLDGALRGADLRCLHDLEKRYVELRGSLSSIVGVGLEPGEDVPMDYAAAARSIREWIQETDRIVADREAQLNVALAARSMPNIFALLSSYPSFYNSRPLKTITACLRDWRYVRREISATLNEVVANLAAFVSAPADAADTSSDFHAEDAYSLACSTCGQVFGSVKGRLAHQKDKKDEAHRAARWEIR